MLRSSVWVYSKKEGDLVIRIDEDVAEQYLYPPKFELDAEWNFLWITPYMADKNLNGLKGDCNIEKAYGWWTERQTWDLIAMNDAPFNQNMAGQGFIVKVSNACILGSSINPPALPELPDANNNLPSSDAINSDFPKTIGEFTLKSVMRDDKKNCAQLEGKDVCVEISRLEYVAANNLVVHVLPVKVTSGKEVYISYIKSHTSEKNAGGVYGVYRGEEPWELYWFPNNGYDVIGTQDYRYVPQSDGSTTTSLLNATTTNSVTKWFLKNYLPTN